MKGASRHFRIVLLSPNDYVLTTSDLHERLGHTYRDGYRDGRERSPFRAGWWLGPESRAAMNSHSCSNPAACGPICECSEPRETDA